MKINLNALKPILNKTLEEDMTFEEFDMSSIESFKKINSCHVKARVEDFDDIIRVEVDVEASLTLTCAYSLEDVNHVIKTTDFFDFSTNEAYEDDNEIFYVDKPEIILDQYILGLLITEAPTKVIKEGATLPKSGKGYEVITEEEYEKRKENATDPRFAALDNLNLDD